MKIYSIENPNNETYIETLLVDGVMVNVFMDDAGQSYYLQYYDVSTDEIVEVGCGTYETQYRDVAQSLFGDPRKCEFYTASNDRCEEMAEPYCHRCPCYFLVQDRDARLAEKGEKYDD